jgi:hypothetical protein
MTEGEIYSVSMIWFVSILGLKDHTHYPKNLHDQRAMELK